MIPKNYRYITFILLIYASVLNVWCLEHDWHMVKKEPIEDRKVCTYPEPHKTIRALYGRSTLKNSLSPYPSIKVIPFAMSTWLNYGCYAPQDSQSIALGFNQSPYGQIWNVSNSIPRITEDIGGRIASYGPLDTLWTLAYTNDGAHILNAGTGNIQLWNRTSKEVMLAVQNPDDKQQEPQSLYSAFFNLDSTRIVGTYFESNMGIWDSQSGNLIQNITEPTTTINQARYDNSANIIIAAGNDGFTRRYDTRSGNCIDKYVGFGYMLAARAIDDNRFVATGWPDPSNTYDQEPPNVLVYDIRNKSAMPLTGHAGPVTCVAISPDQKTIITGGADATVRFWNTATGKPLTVGIGHTSIVNSIEFDSTGNKAISTSCDSTAQEWLTPTNH